MYLYEHESLKLKKKKDTLFAVSSLESNRTEAFTLYARSSIDTLEDVIEKLNRNADCD